MTDIAEKRRSALISLTYFAIFAVLYYIFVKFAFWIVAPFIVAFIIAMVLQRPIRFLSRKTFLNKKLTSVVFVLLIVVVLIALVALIGYRIWTEFYSFYQYISAKFGNYTETIETIRTWVIGVLSHLPTALSNKAKETIDGLTGSILTLAEKSESEAAATASSASSSGIDLSVLTSPLSGIWSTAKQIPSILAAVLIAVVACFFMTSDYDGFTGMIKHSLSEEHEATLVRAKHIIVNVLGKWCKSYAILLFITFCEMSLGLLILKLCGVYTSGYIFVIAAITAILDILPVFGTGTILIPWAVISLFTHKIGMAVGLIVIYAVITVIRQILEPKIVSSNVDMHPVVTIMGMYIGLQVFGALGIIIVPITMVIIKTLNREGVIHLWGRYNKEPAPAAVTAGEAPEEITEENKEEKKD